MRGLFESYDRIDRSTSPGFIVRAFFPWVFVVLINVIIYETAVPDGWSLVQWFAKLNENLQVYSALTIVMSIAALAAVSDGVVDQVVRPYRLENLKALALPDLTEGDDQQFDAAFLNIVKRLDEKYAARILDKIDEARTAVHRSVILGIAFGASIALNTYLLARYQPNMLLSFLIIAVLWVAMAGTFYLASYQIKVVTTLDKLLVKWAQEPKPPPNEYRTDGNLHT
jgi:hypothetical protein